MLQVCYLREKLDLKAVSVPVVQVTSDGKGGNE